MVLKKLGFWFLVLWPVMLILSKDFKTTAIWTQFFKFLMFLQPQSYLTNCSSWLYQGSLMNLRSCGFILFVCFWSKVWILSFSKVVMWFLSMQGGEAFFRNVLESIQEVYLKRNPTAKAVLDLVQSVDNDKLVYDHLAFRTFGVRLLLYYLLHIDKLSWLLGYTLLDHLLYLVIVKCCRFWKITVCSNPAISIAVLFDSISY